MEQPPMSEAYYVYLACCANGTLYVGYTSNVEQRMAAHNAGLGGRYTRTNRPISLVAAWPFNSKAEALQAERALKRFPPERKLAMAESMLALQGEGV
jgi:putative endonuclease